jgi:hypothetical protein
VTPKEAGVFISFVGVAIVLVLASDMTCLCLGIF